MWKLLLVASIMFVLLTSSAFARPMPGPKTYKAPHTSYLDLRK